MAQPPEPILGSGNTGLPIGEQRHGLRPILVRILPLNIFNRNKLYGQICLAAKWAQRLPMASHGGRWWQAIQHAAAM